jgi:hypothetical protein
MHHRGHLTLQRCLTRLLINDGLADSMRPELNNLQVHIYVPSFNNMLEARAFAH